MSLTIDATDISTVWTCENTTGAVGNKPVPEAEIIKEGSNSIGFTTTESNTVAGYDGAGVPTTLTSADHIRIWYASITFPNMASEALGGMRLYATDGLNLAYWYIEGKDTYQGGWVNLVVGMNQTPDSGVMPNLNILSEFGIIHGDGASITYASRPKNLTNVWVDYFRYGDGYACYGTDWSFYDISTGDSSNGYGVVVEYEGIYFVSGKVQIGRDSEATEQSDIGNVISFVDAPVNDGLYGIQYVGHASSTIEYDGCVFTTAGKSFFMDLSDTTFSGLTFENNTVQGANECFFSNDTDSSIQNNSFDGCIRIYPSGSTFVGNTINNVPEDDYTSLSGTVSGSTYFDANAHVNLVTDCSFLNYSDCDYAIYFDDTVVSGTALSFDGNIFDHSGTADVYWAGTDGTLTINLSNGSNANSYASAGGTVEFVSTTDFTLTGLKSDGVPGTGSTEVRIYTSGLTELAGQEDVTTGEFTYQYGTAQIQDDVIVQIHHVEYETIRLTVNLDGSDASIPIQQQFDRNYYNP